MTIRRIRGGHVGESVPGGRLNGSASELIVYFANSPWYGPAGTDRHIAEALGRHSPVLYVEPPISALTALRNPAYARVFSSAPPLEVLGPRLARVVTRVAPGMYRPGLHRLTAPMVRRATRSAIRRLYPGARAANGWGEPIAGIVSCRVDDLWGTVPARRRLLFATDDLPAGADLLGIPRERLVRNEARALRGADVVAVVSPGLRQRYSEQGRPATLIPNGCLPEAYDGVDSAEPPDDARLPGPVAGFVGHLNDRIDLALLEATADTGVSLLIVGPAAPGFQPERLAALARRPNVCWVGAKPFAQLPSYLRLIDAGLTPYADTAFNRNSFPLKTLEYLAAGRGVVATPLPANDWLDTDLITVAAGPAGFAGQVRAVLATPRTSILAERRRAFAREHSWARRAETLAGLLQIPVPTEHVTRAGLSGQPESTTRYAQRGDR
jgi:teichuronic acid biosynthesis glycosyltransferase TuaH